MKTHNLLSLRHYNMGDGNDTGGNHSTNETGSTSQPGTIRELRTIGHILTTDTGNFSNTTRDQLRSLSSNIHARDAEVRI